MDFYRHQEKAYRNSAVLLLILLASVFGAVTYTYVVLRVILYYPNLQLIVLRACEIQGKGAENCTGFWYPELYLFLTTVISLTILGTILLYYVELADPSFFPLKVLNGKEVEATKPSRAERQLLNVVEEMSIASGVMAPQVFVLPNEPGINALALGISPHRSGICVTQGCLDQLTRDELQAVVAHEFSHIWNEDGKFNAHLLAILHGVLYISNWGRLLLRPEWYREDPNSMVSALFSHVAGMLLLLFFRPPVLFTTLVQRAISRQREFLADAFAVQFTRDVDGLTGALHKIQRHAQSSAMRSTFAEEAGHMFFCCVYGEQDTSVLSTHPPLRERIKRVSPYKAQLIKTEERSEAERDWSEFTQESKRSGFGPITNLAANLSYAHHLVEALPIEIHDACHSPTSAAYILMSLILDKEQEQILSQQLKIVESNCEFERGHLLLLFKEVAKLDKSYRLPLVEISIPYLQRLTSEKQGEFINLLDSLARADKKISLFEYVLLSIVKQTLKRTHSQLSPKYFSLRPILPSCRLILSTLAHIGNKERVDAEGSYAAGASRISLTEALLIRDVCGLAATSAALEEISLAIRPIREAVLDACILCVSYDRHVTIEEAEMLRAIGALIDVTLPLQLVGSSSPVMEASAPG